MAITEHNVDSMIKYFKKKVKVNRPVTDKNKKKIKKK